MTDVIAVDSLTYSRWKRTNPFHGLIGATVSIHNPDKFKGEYAEKMANSLLKVGLESTKMSYSSSALARRFFDELGAGYKELGLFLKSFIDSLCDNISISVFFATCNPEKYPRTVIFTGEKDSGRTELVPTMEFLRDWVSQYFPVICAWKLIKCTNIYRKKFYLDGFRGPITNAWNELIKGNDVQIFPLGDDYNPFISFADLIVRYVNEALRMKRLFLNKENIELVLSELSIEESHVHYTFHNDLQNLVPLYKEENSKSNTGKQIFVKNFRKRPIIFLLKEGSKVIKEDSEWLKQTPFFDKVCDLAFEVDGSVSFYDKHQDKIMDGDKVIYYGPKGKAMAKEIDGLLKGVGRDIELIYSRDLFP